MRPFVVPFFPIALRAHVIRTNQVFHQICLALFFPTLHGAQCVRGGKGSRAKSRAHHRFFPHATKKSAKQERLKSQNMTLAQENTFVCVAMNPFSVSLSFSFGPLAQH